jgi:hypothetical protein
MAYYGGRVWGRRNWAAALPSTPKPMNAQYAGKCRTCGGPIAVGDPILYQRGVGAKHATVAGCELAAAAKVAQVAAATTATPVVDMTSVVAFLDVAKANGLKFPKVRFVAPGGGELKLSVAGAKAAVPGSINVVVRDEWLGRINPDGTAYGRRGQALSPELVALLVRIASDPATAAKEYGALTGNCSFCTKALTDAGSVEVGYGPVCAKKYGLPHKPKGTPVPSAALAA